MKSRLLGVIVALVVFISAGVGAAEVSIAILVPLTGGGAFYGKIMRDVGVGVIEDINSKGGVKNFGKINYRVYDSASDPAVSASMIERAKSAGTTFVWGGFASAVEEMMVRKANELKIPTMLTNEHTYTAIPRENRYAITPVLSTMEIGQICAKYFKEKGVKTYAFIGADYIYGRSWEKSLRMHLENSGIKQAYINWHDFNKVDYTADIIKLKDLKPDAIVRSYGGAGEYVIVKQMKNAGYWPKIFIANVTMAGYQVTLDELGEDVVGVTGATTQDPDNLKWIEFAREHKKRFGVRPTWLSHGMHDTLWLAKLTVEKANSLDPEKLAKAMREVKLEGVSAYPLGPFTEYGYVKKGTMHLLEWTKGSPVWSNDIKVHMKTVSRMEATALCKEDVEKILARVQ